MDAVQKQLPMKVAILGSGVTGQAIAQFCHKRDIPSRIFTEGNRPDWEDFTCLIYSPGAINSPLLCEAGRAGIPCMNDLDFAQKFYSNRTIAITGTNGKTSTAEMLHHIFKKLHIPSLLTGNIGIPPISRVEQFNKNPKTWNICEISSFQARDLAIFRPDYALWTNFAPNHLDTHETLEDYFLSKWNLMRRVHKVAVVDSSVFQWPFAKNLQRNRILEISTKGANGTESVLPCVHQAANFHLIRVLLKKIFPARPIDSHLLADFSLPPHRLCPCGTVENLAFWNDSKATNSAAVKAALAHVKKFSNHLIWVTCGKSKGEDMENFRPIVSAADRVLVTGEIGEIFLKHFPASNVYYCQSDESLIEQIHACATTLGGQKCAVLLSPGFSSFDRFKNYEERGRWFECLVERIMKQNHPPF
ncbi:MAG: UDP-N-acetylmuramoyl-L-alanine--D-glutamate ligase [Puniceicoccales bacterium]|jgi:UDP-N-acetylmuramoylalanine--D-glutamate ligase|nr:UDP-N-acetylmuramoyl-L-alanine--D-glutamate ligase [Puniceicoccales bacterium]